MNEKQLYRHLSDILEHAVPESIDLWPRIRRQVVIGKPTRRPIARITWAFGVTLALAVGTVVVALALSPMEEAASVIYGVEAIYEAGLYTEVNQSQQLEEIAVTVLWVYADPNLVLIAYSQEGAADSGHESGAVLSSVMEGSGIELQPLEASGYDPVAIAVYEMPPKLSEADELFLQATFQGMRRAIPTIASSPTAPSATQIDPSTTTTLLEPTIEAPPETIGAVTFDLHVPVTPGRSITVDQVAQAGGLSMSVQRVVLAPSSARAEVCFDVPDSVGYEWFIWGQLSTGLQSVEGGSRDFVSGEAHPCVSVLFEDQLTLDAARYTLRIQEIVGFRLDALGEQWRIPGPWVFEIEAGK